MSDKLKGTVFSLIAATGYASVYIIARFAQRYVTTDVFLPWWFLMASIYSTTILLIRKEFGRFLKSIRKHKFFFIYFGLSESVGTFTFFYLLRIMNPSVISFVSNLSPVAVAFWGFLILREKLTGMETFGGLVAVSGVLLISRASPGGELVKILVVVLMVMFFAFNTVLVRIKVRGEIPPIYIVSLRTYALFAVYFAYHVLKNGAIIFPEPHAIPYIVVGSLIGPVAATFSVIHALQYLKAADVSIIKSVQPLLVSLGSYLFLGQSPTKEQFIGGLLIIVSVNIVILGNREVIKDQLPEEPCE